MADATPDLDAAEKEIESRYHRRMATFWGVIGGVCALAALLLGQATGVNIITGILGIGAVAAALVAVVHGVKIR